MSSKIKRGEVWWVNLDPTVGSEINKKRPVLVVSPDPLNERLKTVIAVPCTSNIRDWPFRVRIESTEKTSEAACDQVRVLDKSRFSNKMCSLTEDEISSVLKELRYIFE